MKITVTKPEEFDRACMIARDHGDVIEVADGVKAVTRGAWAFPAFKTLGAGVDLVFGKGASLDLVDADREGDWDGKGRRPHPDKLLHILTGAGQNTLQGGTLNLRGGDYPGWVVSGVRFYGHYIAHETRITGQSGDRAIAESFAISSEGDTGGSVVRNVRVSSPATDGPHSYNAGIYLGGTVPTDVVSRVDGCVVELGPHGQFAFSSSYATVFSKCHGEAMRLWYTDTDAGVAVLDACSGKASYSAFGCVAQTPNSLRNLVATDCTVDAFEGNTVRVIEYWDKGGTHSGSMSLLRGTYRGFLFRAAVVANSGAVNIFNSEINVDRDHIGGTVKPFVL